MNGTLNLSLLATSLAIGTTAIVSPANATTLFFSQLVNGVQIQNYFNGGAASNGAIGPNDGVVFSPNANEQRQGFNGNAPSGGTGKFENNPSGLNGVLYFPFSSLTTSYLNDTSGFTSLSFGYSLLNNSSAFDDTVAVYSGLNGTGVELASLSLTPNSTAVSCAGSPSTSTSGASAKDEFCTWSTASASNFGVAQSILFGPTGSSNLQDIEFDDVQVTPIPAAFPLFATGLGAVGLFAWLSKRKAGSTVAA